MSVLQPVQGRHRSGHHVSRRGFALASTSPALSYVGRRVLDVTASLFISVLLFLTGILLASAILDHNILATVLLGTAAVAIAEFTYTQIVTTLNRFEEKPWAS